MVYVAVRVRGTVNVKPDIRRTLHLLKLKRANHCVLLDENKSVQGMLQVAKDYVTWGKIDKDVLTQLIQTRGKIERGEGLTDEYIKTATSYKSIEQLSQAILDNKIGYKDIPKVKPLFRLSPPKKGYEGIKRSYATGGAIGYRGKDINKLIKRMI